MLGTASFTDYISNDGNRNFRDGKDFGDKALLYQMTRLQVRKEPMRVIDSEFMLFLEPEGFYAYGFFFFWHKVFYVDWNVPLKVYSKYGAQSYMNIFVLCTRCTNTKYIFAGWIK